MTGAEIAKILRAACEDAGLDEDQKLTLTLAFSLRWAEKLKEDIDFALHESELREPE